MDSPVAFPAPVPTFTAMLPGWTLLRGREPDELTLPFLPAWP